MFTLTPLENYMTEDEFRAKIARASYFCDDEGRLKIVEVNKDSFLAEAAGGDLYELFYSDYVLERQKFEIIA